MIDSTWHHRAGPPLFAALALALASPAAAGPWNPDRGQLELTDAAVAHTFDDGAAGPAIVRVFGPSGQLEPAEIAALVRDADPLEGSGALELGGAGQVLTAELSALSALEGRRVRISLWQRARGQRIRAYLGWWVQDLPVARSLDTSGHRLSLVRFLPSGRVTSDGWEELTSGPIDFMLGGRRPPVLFVNADVDDLHMVSRPDPEARTWVDALAIEDLGAAAVPDARCSLFDEAEVCGDSGACYLGRCADHAAVYGPVFERIEDRRAYVERRLFEVETFAGHQGLRAKIPELQQRLRALPDGPAARFWRDLTEAWLDLADGHAGPPVAGYSAPPSSGLCLTQGVADLVPGAPEVPLVFSKANLHAEVRDVQVGDALVAIDGRPVAEWRALAKAWLNYHGDPDNAAYVESLDLGRVLALAGARLDFARCAGPEACDAATLETYSLDLGERQAPFWAGESPLWRGATATCDGRFRRISDEGQALVSTFATSTEQDGATVLMINAVPGTFQQGWQAWGRNVSAAFAPVPARMILDQRIGNGGGFESVSLLAGYLYGASADAEHFLMPWLGDLEGDPTRFEPMVECGRSYPSTSAFLWCGGARVEQVTEHPGPGSADGTRLAVLNGRDASGNDFLAYLLARRPGPTRIFGPGPTIGAFGMIMSLPEHRVGLTGGGLQATDAVIRLTPDVPLDARLSGPGVPPDEVVLQRQSDAVRGVDTLMEVAHAWLRQ